MVLESSELVQLARMKTMAISVNILGKLFNFNDL